MKSAAILDVVVNAQTTKAQAELKKFDKTLDKSAASAKETDKSFGALGKRSDDLNKRVVNTNAKFELLNNTISLLKFPTIIAGAGAAAQAVGVLGAGAVSLGSALAPLGGMLAAYPALLTTMGQAAGVKALAGVDDLTAAVGGLSEKMDKSSEEFKALTPEARRFANALEAAKGPVKDMQSRVQSGLFPGLDKGLTAAMKNFDVLRKVMAGTARTMGSLAAKAGELVGSEGFGNRFAKIGESNRNLMERLGKAGINMGDALSHVMVVARPLVNWMGKLALGWSQSIKGAVKLGRETGSLADFFGKTERMMDRVLSISGHLAAGFIEIGKAAAPLGRQLLRQIEDVAASFEKWTKSAEGRNSLKDYFSNAKAPLLEMGRLIGDAGKAFLDLSQTPGLQKLIKQFRTELLPVFTDLIKTTTTQLGPRLIDLGVQVGKLFGNFAGTAGPLNRFVELLTAGLRVFNNLLDASPGLKSLAVGFVSLAGIIKAMKFAGAISGVSSLIGMMGRLRSSTAATFTQFRGLNLSTVAGGKSGAQSAGVGLGTVFGTAFSVAMIGNIVEGTDQLTEKWNSLKPAIALHFTKEWAQRTDELTSKQRENFTQYVKGLEASGEATHAEVREILNDIRKVDKEFRRAQDAQGRGTGFGIAKAIAADGKLAAKEVKGIINDLKKLPEGARKEAADMLTGMTAAMESKGNLAKGASAKIRKAIIDNFEDMNLKGRKSAEQMADRISNKFGTLGDDVSRFVSRLDTGLMPKFVGAFRSVASQLPGILGTVVRMFGGAIDDILGMGSGKGGGGGNRKPNKKPNAATDKSFDLGMGALGAPTSRKKKKKKGSQGPWDQWFQSQGGGWPGVQHEQALNQFNTQLNEAGLTTSVLDDMAALQGADGTGGMLAELNNRKDYLLKRIAEVKDSKMSKKQKAYYLSLLGAELESVTGSISSTTSQIGSLYEQLYPAPDTDTSGGGSTDDGGITPEQQAIIDAQNAAAEAAEAARIAAEEQTAALNALKASVDQQNAIAGSELSVGLTEARRALADMISGQIGSNAYSRGNLAGAGAATRY